jgi:hypothetical protein
MPYVTIKEEKMILALYHYTEKQAYTDIINSGILLPSEPWTQIDSFAGGPGWYFTNLKPNECDIKISKACWLDKNLLSRVACYFEFTIDNSIVINTRTNVYVLKKNIITDGKLGIFTTYNNNYNTPVIKLSKHGAKESCHLKPCATCSIAKSY